MKMPDVNVLVYAHRGDQPAHAFYRRWMEDLVQSRAPFAMSTLVGVAFVRIVTHPGFPGRPTPLAIALETIEQVREAPNCRWLVPGERHWEIVADLCRRSRCLGKRVADAQHAAVAMEHGCRWVSRDADFEAFVPCGLDWEHLVPD